MKVVVEHMNVSVVINGECFPTHRRKPHLIFDVIGPVKEQNLPGPVLENTVLQLTDSQQCDLSIAAVDKKGNPAPVQNPTFASSDETVATVVVDSTDPSKAVVVAGAPGVCQVQVGADADMGDGITPLTGTLDITVVGGQAVSLAVSAGTPVEQA